MAKSTKTLITIDKEIYTPVFNEEDDTYIDMCPYVPYQRKCIEYICSCRAGASFFNNASYKQHIKSKTHLNYIKNYKKYNAQIYERDETIKILKVELELTKRKMNKYKTLVDNIDDLMFQDC